MTPNDITGALRDFAAAARHSPEPSQAVADLAVLLAGLVDRLGEDTAKLRGYEPYTPAPAPAPAPFPSVDNPGGVG